MLGPGRTGEEGESRQWRLREGDVGLRAMGKVKMCWHEQRGNKSWKFSRLVRKVLGQNI